MRSVRPYHYMAILTRIIRDSKAVTIDATEEPPTIEANLSREKPVLSFAGNVITGVLYHTLRLKAGFVPPDIIYGVSSFLG